MSYEFVLGENASPIAVVFNGGAKKEPIQVKVSELPTRLRNLQVTGQSPLAIQEVIAALEGQGIQLPASPALAESIFPLAAPCLDRK